MNSFETDMRRAIASKGFMAGLAAGFLILMQTGFDSELYRISFPLLAALPYTTAWIMDEQSGYLRSYLVRCSRRAYIFGKFISCVISGGLVASVPCILYMLCQKEAPEGMNLSLVFFSGMLWAAVSVVLAAVSRSRYLAYGGGFVIYYLLVILHERYFMKFYCLYPYEWLNPVHIWIFDSRGILFLLTGILLILCFGYYECLDRRIERG